MKITLSHSQTMEFLRQDEYANWSYEQADALVTYYEELEDDMGQEIELDVVAIRCDWNKYDDWDELAGDYSDYFKDNDIKTIDDLREYTQVIEVKDGTLLVGTF